jgi:DNA-binding transcriptional regulator YhcF (GntR family)
MSNPDTRRRAVPKYLLVAASVRAQIEDGALLPGELGPSGAALARKTGYSVLTCRRALRVLIVEGVLVSGASSGARPRVPARDPSAGDRNLANAKRALSASLGAHRRAAGLTQPELAKIVGRSVTSVGHAETGRVWQSRSFWELADKGVNAGGKLLALYDAYLAAIVGGETAMEDFGDGSEEISVAAAERTTSVNIIWADGKVTIVYPPASQLSSP